MTTNNIEDCIEQDTKEEIVENTAKLEIQFLEK